MSRTAQHHAEWLSLVETSGPFLSLPVLLRVFPQDLEGRDPERAARLREAYADWLERGPKIAAVHQAWVRHVLTDLLGYSPEFLLEGQAIPPGLEARFPVHGETLRPDLVLRHRDATAKPCLLIKAYPPDQNLAKAVAGSRWNAAPGTRMMELLHATDQPLGLVTNGEQWMLVYAPRGETTGFASWYADLWMQEPITLRAFHSLLRQHRLIGVADADTLSALLAESAKDQQEVTDQLGKQVRQAVEVLVQALDHIDADTQRTLLADIAEKDIYNSALTVMMRLVFLFSAEERELLPLNDAFYAENYAASTLSAQLRERADQFGEEVLERRHDAWGRLLATFRAVHGGVLHDRLQLPAYGGSLFDPDRYPFLEGRSVDTRWRYTPAKPLPINNRVVLHLLEALQFLRIKVRGAGAERRRLSFRALDIEQIGHVYEGLLDHTARRAASVVLGLDGKNEPELPLGTLEAKTAEGQEKLVEFLTEETGKSAKAVAKALAAPVPDEFALQHACGNEMRLVDRVRPFADFIRTDSFGRLLVILPGSLYVTSGSDRRSTGTHYTPRSLTEPVVKHTLEPLVYTGPAEGLPQDQWMLKSPKEILALKVCDLAMGSGAFLVQACRYLAERLVEAWERAERDHPDQVLVTPDGELSAASPAERLLPPDAAERLALARRYVADRCLYGVDINPMAVEMAKLSLWLITLQRDRPFTFLDHAFKCGDSLLGVTSVKQIENFSLRPGDRQVTFATANLFRYIEAAAEKRRALEALPSNDNAQIGVKTRLHIEAQAEIAKLNALADILVAFELRGLSGDDYEHQRAVSADHAEVSLKKSLPSIQAYAAEQLKGRSTFHWITEFPEVFNIGGFSAVVGNPPFMGGSKISGCFGQDYREFITSIFLKKGQTNPDLCAYFFLRGIEVNKTNSATLSFVATSAIKEGITREVVLDPLAESGIVLYRALSSSPWPGAASVTYTAVWLYKGDWCAPAHLDDIPVGHITPYLKASESSAVLHPKHLAINENIAFKGVQTGGMGFVLNQNERDALIERDSINGRVLAPYLTGQEINISPSHSPSRWAINFGEMPLVGASEHEDCASNYPDCLKIIEAKVKPEREQNNRQVYREKWWQYSEKRPALYGHAKKLSKFLCLCTQATKYILWAYIDPKTIVSYSVAVVASESKALSLVLHSAFHDLWVRSFTSNNLSLIRYTIADCFENYPFPFNPQRGKDQIVLEKLGDTYHNARKRLLDENVIGLTELYNRLNDSAVQTQEIRNLRALHVEMDQAVAAAYGWSDLDLGHDFYPTKQGERYTISETARRTVLDRLLALNHERHAEEVAAGLHDKKGKKPALPADGTAPAPKRRGRPAKSAEPSEPELF